MQAIICCFELLINIDALTIIWSQVLERTRVLSIELPVAVEDKYFRSRLAAQIINRASFSRDLVRLV
jgi:hypothetical protein